MAGRHSGKTGTVLSINAGKSVVLTDNNNEIIVLVNDMSKSGETNIDQVDVGTNLKKFDLIKLVEFNEVGLVLSV